jgi:hypothetical protein
MDIPFYKAIFDRELDRRKDLDDAINQPVTVSAALIALLYFLYSDAHNIDNHTLLECLIIILIYLSFLGFTVTLFFLAQSYNNLLSGFNYQEPPSANDIREYEKKLEAYHQDKNEKKKAFDDYLLRTYITCASEYTKINDTRSRRLYYAKRTIIASLFIATFAIILFAVKHTL